MSAVRAAGRTTTTRASRLVAGCGGRIPACRAFRQARRRVGLTSAMAESLARRSAGRASRLVAFCEAVETEAAGAATKEEDGAESEDGASEAQAEGQQEEVEETPAYAEVLEKLRAAAEGQAAQAGEENAKLKDQYLRLNADFDNYRKRTESEKESLAKNARGSTLEELLPVIDNFELARTQLVLETKAEQKVSESYQNLYKQLVETLKKLGLEPVEAVGAKFDPELHDAIMQEETTDFEDGAVMEEYRRGFAFGDRLLRAAMVKVAVNSSSGQEEEATAENSESEEAESEGGQGE